MLFLDVRRLHGPHLESAERLKLLSNGIGDREDAAPIAAQDARSHEKKNDARSRVHYAAERVPDNRGRDCPLEP